jgi:hypothetical protein
MKTRNLLLGMACMAAFTACSNNEEPVMPAAQTRVVTINVGTGADTRSALAVDGVSLKRTWASTDKLSILFLGEDNTAVLENFNLKSGAGTTSAVFEKSDSKLPATGTTNVLVWVDPLDADYESFDVSVQDGTLSGSYVQGSLSSNDWLTTETTVTDGEFPASVTLESKTIFLKIPAGTQLINNATGDQSYLMTVYNDNIVSRYNFSISDEGFNYNRGTGGYVNIRNPALKDGKLVDDCYIAMMKKGDITSLTIKLNEYTDEFELYATDNEITVREFKTPLEFGHIYNIQQSDLTLSE